MEKKILVIYYSQTGQLKEITDNFLASFQESGLEVETIAIEPEDEYTFPWTGKRFFDVMPESVMAMPTRIRPLGAKSEKYDLIVFAYQPWYLSPSIPATSALKHPDFARIVKDTPVVTLVGARNMWLNAQEKVKRLLAESQAKLVGNIALVDRHSNLASAVSILHWMLNGKKEKFMGIFPKPGISDEDIKGSARYGKIVFDHLISGNWNLLQPNLVKEGAIEVKPNLMFIEGRAGRLFSIWANFIKNRKNRAFWLSVFKYYLIIALFFVAPIVLLINMIFFKPFVGGSIKRKKDYYKGIELIS